MLAECLDANPDVDAGHLHLATRADRALRRVPRPLAGDPGERPDAASGADPAGDVRGVSRAAAAAGHRDRADHAQPGPAEGDQPARDRAAAATERRTTLFIRLNDSTDVDRPHATIVHGHYRDWFARYPRPERQRGRFAYFGLIRQATRPSTPCCARSARSRRMALELSLTVGGKPSTDELRCELETLAAGDPRVTMQLEFLPDEDLVSIASAAELIVLPYREMHNSGGVLAALSLDRPVLSPDNEVNRRLGEEVGERWVHRFEPPLTAEILLDALAGCSGKRPPRPTRRPTCPAATGRARPSSTWRRTAAPSRSGGCPPRPADPPRPSQSAPDSTPGQPGARSNRLRAPLDFAPDPLTSHPACTVRATPMWCRVTGSLGESPTSSQTRNTPLRIGAGCLGRAGQPVISSSSPGSCRSSASPERWSSCRSGSRGSRRHRRSAATRWCRCC